MDYVSPSFHKVNCIRTIAALFASARNKKREIIRLPSSPLHECFALGALSKVANDGNFGGGGVDRGET